MSDTIKKRVGLGTAYGFAKAGGYEGTVEQFTELLGNIAIDLARIENLSVTVTTLPAGSQATASLNGSVLSLGIPKGDKGDKGNTGNTPDFGIGTVTTLSAGSSATASITGTAEAPVLNLGIPEGQAGSGAVGTVASAYSSSSTYAVGDYAIHNSNLYRCTTAITTAEAWTSAHWTQVALADDVSDLKSELELYTGNKSYTYTKNKSVSNSSPITQSSETSWESVIVPCTEGDVFNVLGYGGSSTRLWMFADSEGNLISQSAAQLRINYYVTITAPPNAAYLSCNSMYTNTAGSLIKGELLGLAVEKAVTEIESDLALSQNGYMTFKGMGNFQHYGLNTDGTFIISQMYRVSNNDPITINRDITINVKSGFKWGFIPFVDNTAQAWMGWFTTPQTIMAGTSFVIQIARTTENTSEIADVNEFLSNVLFMSPVEEGSFIAETIQNYLGLDTINTTWEQGGIDSSGEIESNTRIRTGFLPIYDGLNVNSDTRFSAVIIQYDGAKNFISGTSWASGSFEVAPETNAVYFRAVLSKNPIGLPPAILPNESGAVSIKYKVLNMWKQFNDLENIVNGLDKSRTYKYIGQSFPSKVNSFDITQLFTMSYQSGATSQDIEIFDNYLFVSFSGTEQIRVYSMSDYSLVATITAETNHGSGMQFSNEYYDDDDDFPMLYIGGWTNNIINVLRITNTGGTWTATKVKSLYIPTNYGYYASPSIDKSTNILYTYAHSNGNIPNADNMVIASWNLESLTDNLDGTYTPELINSCESPNIGTYQGHKYYGGKIYITSSRSSSPYNQKLFAIDCGTGNVVTSINMADVLTTETEGLCYQINGNNIEWILSEYLNVFKILF